MLGIIIPYFQVINTVKLRFEALLGCSSLAPLHLRRATWSVCRLLEPMEPRNNISPADQLNKILQVVGNVITMQKGSKS